MIRTGPWEFSKHVVTALSDKKAPSFDGYVRRVPEGNRKGWDYSEQELRAMPIIPTATEEEVFCLAGIPYRTPKQRT
jgi:hypothetical protein